MSSFLLPEVQKQAMRKGVAANQRRFLQAAHKEIYAATKDAVVRPKSRPSTVHEAADAPPTSMEPAAEPEASSDAQDDVVDAGDAEPEPSSS